MIRFHFRKFLNLYTPHWSAFDCHVIAGKKWNYVAYFRTSKFGWTFLFFFSFSLCHVFPVSPHKCLVVPWNWTGLLPHQHFSHNPQTSILNSLCSCYLQSNQPYILTDFFCTKYLIFSLLSQTFCTVFLIIKFLDM